MILLYTILMSFAIVIAYPFAWVSALLGSTYLRERLNPPSDVSRDDIRRIWIHSASVGEARIAFSMAGEIKQKFSSVIVFISTTTYTGLERVKSLIELSDEKVVDKVFLAPFDQPFITSRFVKVLKPTSFILVETELWPWLIKTMHRTGVPVTIINGKLSKRAFRRYMLIHFALKDIVNKISLLCVQTRSFAKRYQILGAPVERIEILGNVKFDSLPDPANYHAGVIRQILGIPSKGKVFVAGSTRPGEEEIIIKSFVSVLAIHPDTFLVLAPRHLNRVPEVERVVIDAGFLLEKRSKGDKLSDDKKRVLILDTMGDLIDAFACSDVAFVGGSLCDFGGHNPLEPAALGIPVLFGPYMEQTGYKELLSEGAARLVHDENDLAKALNTILEGGEKTLFMTHAGPAVVQRFTGTLTRTLDCMKTRHLI